jgi:hypothetical protein
MQHAWWDGTQWQAEILDQHSSHPVEPFPMDSAAVVYYGHPHVFASLDGYGLIHDWWGLTGLVSVEVSAQPQVQPTV